MVSKANRRALERLTAYMQFLLTLVFVVGFFVVVYVVVRGTTVIPAEHLRLADMLFGSLTTVLVQISSYWFSRQRGQEPGPDADPLEPRLPAPPG